MQVILIPFCPNCGKNVEAGKRFCENCGTPITAPASQPAAAPQYTAPPPPPAYAPSAPQGQHASLPPQQKNSALAAIASFLCSGLGQVYNGSLGKGILIFFGTLIGSMIFMIPGIIVWVYGIYDAYTTAKKMNEGQLPFVPHNIMHIIAFIVVVIVVIIIYFIIVMAAMASMMYSSHYY